MAKNTEENEKTTPAVPENTLGNPIAVNPRRGKMALHIAILAVSAALVYSNSLDVPFIFDDIPTIQLNPHIRATHATLEEVVLKPVRGFAGHARPIPMVTFAANHLFGGDDPFGYHLVNIAIHILAAVFLYLFALETLRLVLPRALLEKRPNLPCEAAFWNAAIWTLNPLQVLSVTYLCQRMNAMAAMFSVAALFFYVKGRSRLLRAAESAETGEGRGAGRALDGAAVAFLALSALSVVLGVASKQNVVLTPLLILLYEWFFFRGFDPKWMRRWLLTFPGAAVFLVILAFLWMGRNPLDTLAAGYAGRDFTVWERLLTESRVVFHYLFIYLLPLPSWTRLVYDYRISTSLVSPPTTLLALAALSVCVAWCVRNARKHPLAVFCVAWWFGQLAVESTVIGLEPMYEYRVYAPSMLLFLAPLAAVYAKNPKTLPAKLARYALPALLAAVYAVFTMERNDLMRSPLAFWADARAKAPEDERVAVNYANALRENGRADLAILVLRDALKSHPDVPEALHNLGAALASRKRYAEAEPLIRKALSIQNNYIQAHLTLAALLIDTGRIAEAEPHLRYAAKRRPGNPLITAHLGDLEVAKGNKNKAAEYYREALSKTPILRAACNLGTIYIAEGKLKEAKAVLEEAVSASPAASRPRYLLGVLAMRGGEPRIAVIHFRNALMISPSSIEIRNALDNALKEAMGHAKEIAACLDQLKEKPDDERILLRLGKLLLAAGRPEEAVPRYRQVLSRNSKSLEAMKGLGDAMIMLKRYREAEDYYFMALREAPNNAVLHHNLASAMAYQGKYEPAVVHYREALRLNPEYKEAELNLRKVLGKLNGAKPGGQAQ